MSSYTFHVMFIQSNVRRTKKMIMSGRRVLIAGGGGFLGRGLTPYLQSRGYRIDWLTRCFTKSPRGVSCHIWSSSEAAPWRRKKFTDLIIATGAHRVSVSNQDAGDLYHTHVEVPLRLAMWAAGSGVQRVIHISSGSASQSEKISNDAYTAAKSVAEKLLWNFQSRYDLKILRLFRPYGPTGDRTLINRLLRRAIADEEIVLAHPDGMKIQPIYLDDICAVVAALLEMKGSFDVDLAGNERMTLGALLRLWGEVSGKDVRYRFSGKVKLHDRRISGTGYRELDVLVKTRVAQGLQKIYSSIQ